MSAYGGPKDSQARFFLSGTFRAKDATHDQLIRGLGKAMPPNPLVILESACVLTAGCRFLLSSAATACGH